MAEHTLDPNGLRAAAASGQEYLVSTAAADMTFGVTGDERLDVSLPQGAGQACLEANPNPPAFSCMTWGTITKPSGSQGPGGPSRARMRAVAGVSATTDNVSESAASAMCAASMGVHGGHSRVFTRPGTGDFAMTTMLVVFIAVAGPCPGRFVRYRRLFP